jgi:hypothetical protein
MLEAIKISENVVFLSCSDNSVSIPQIINLNLCECAYVEEDEDSDFLLKLNAPSGEVYQQITDYRLSDIAKVIAGALREGQCTVDAQPIKHTRLEKELSIQDFIDSHSVMNRNNSFIEASELAQEFGDEAIVIKVFKEYEEKYEDLQCREVDEKLILVNRRSR